MFIYLILIYAAFLSQTSSKIYFKFPDIIKCQQSTISIQYYVFWIDDYNYDYVSYRNIYGSPQYSTIAFDGSGNFLWGNGDITLYQTCKIKNITEFD